MTASQKNLRCVSRLCDIRTRFDGEHSREKLQLLRELDGVRVRNGKELERLHGALCFIRAFPDTTAHFKVAHSLLRHFEDRVLALPAAERARLEDSGIIGTPLYYAFSYEVATWMARRLRGNVSFYWDDVDEFSRLDELLELMLLPADVAQYVFIHELCHTRHMNHGAAFWNMVQLYEPDYRDKIEILRSPNMHLPSWADDPERL